MTAKRWMALRPNHAVSEQSITVKEQELKAQAALVKAAEQKVKNIEAFIGFKTIVAPFDGVVIQRNINVGDLVSKEGNLSTPNAITNLFTVAVVDSCASLSMCRSRSGLPPARPDGRRDGAAIARSSFHRQVPDRRPWIRREHAHRDHGLHDRQ